MSMVHPFVHFSTTLSYGKVTRVTIYPNRLIAKTTCPPENHSEPSNQPIWYTSSSKNKLGIIIQRRGSRRHAPLRRFIQRMKASSPALLALAQLALARSATYQSTLIRDNYRPVSPHPRGPARRVRDTSFRCISPRAGGGTCVGASQHAISTGCGRPSIVGIYCAPAPIVHSRRFVGFCYCYRRGGLWRRGAWDE